MPPSPPTPTGAGIEWTQLGFAKQIVIDVIGATPDHFDLSAGAMLVDDLGADSLDFVEIQCLLEGRGFNVPDEVFHSRMTIGDLAALILPTNPPLSDLAAGGQWHPGDEA